jgi:ATP-dependent protease HslVU (ClpYQ) peptidase subunit
LDLALMRHIWCGWLLPMIVVSTLACTVSSVGRKQIDTEASSAVPAGSFRAIIGLREIDTRSSTLSAAELFQQLADSVAERHDLQIDRVLSLSGAFSAVVDSTNLEALQGDEDVRYVEPDRILRIGSTPRQQ